MRPNAGDMQPHVETGFHQEKSDAVGRQGDDVNCKELAKKNRQKELPVQCRESFSYLLFSIQNTNLQRN